MQLKETVGVRIMTAGSRVDGEGMGADMVIVLM